jgi:hypothetical protein
LLTFTSVIAKDTPQTITEVKVNNARREGFCGK